MVLARSPKNQVKIRNMLIPTTDRSEKFFIICGNPSVASIERDRKPMMSPYSGYWMKSTNTRVVNPSTKEYIARNSTE